MCINLNEEKLYCLAQSYYADKLLHARALAHAHAHTKEDYFSLLSTKCDMRDFRASLTFIMFKSTHALYTCKLIT